MLVCVYCTILLDMLRTYLTVYVGVVATSICIFTCTRACHDAHAMS